MASFQDSIQVDCGRSAVFELVADVQHFCEFLNPMIEVELLGQESKLRAGLEVHLMMTRYCIRQSVSLKVEDFLRGSRLTYRQTEGLLQSYWHTLRFEELSPDKTLITSVVNYEAPYGILGRLLDDVWLKRNLKGVVGFYLKRLQSSVALLPQTETSNSRNA